MIPKIPLRYCGQETIPVKGAPGIFTIPGDENLQSIPGLGLLRVFRVYPTDFGSVNWCNRGIFSPGGASYPNRVRLAKEFARIHGWSIVVGVVNPTRLFWTEGDRLRSKTLKGTPILVGTKYCEGVRK